MEIIAPFGEIGDRLRKARVARGLSIDDLHFLTRLPKNVIRALEADDFAVFSGPIYARSFLTQYSDFLQVDASDWLGAIESAEYIPDGESIHLIDKPGEKPGKEPARSQPPSMSFVPVLGFFAVTGLLVWGASKLYRDLEAKLGGSEPPPVVESPALESMTSETPPAGPSETPPAGPSEVPPSGQSPAKLPEMADGAKEKPPRAIFVRED